MAPGAMIKVSRADVFASTLLYATGAPLSRRIVYGVGEVRLAHGMDGTWFSLLPGFALNGSLDFILGLAQTFSCGIYLGLKFGQLYDFFHWRLRWEKPNDRFVAAATQFSFWAPLRPVPQRPNESVLVAGLFEREGG